MHMMKEDVMVDIHARNNHIAEHVHEHLAEHGIFAVNIMGAPGTGKTTTLENLLQHLGVPGYVIEGDIESNIDTERLRRQNIAATQINTFGACHLDAPLVHNAIHALQFDRPGILFIENVGNLVCPAEFDTGAVRNAMILSVPEGDDKPLKYPLMFSVCDLVLINKIDVMPYFDFDLERCKNNIHQRNPKAKIIPICAKTGEGMDAFAEWLLKEVFSWKK